VFELSPPLLQHGGLRPAIEWLAESIGEQWGLEVDCECAVEPPVLSDAVAVTLFQGVRELLINAAKHAEARRAVLRLDRDGDVLRLVVADDGRGFERQWLESDLEAPMCSGDGRKGGTGLYSLRSRIELLGGCLTLRNGPRGGAEACLSIPLDARMA
jgi:signal transduction histidine kinase